MIEVKIEELAKKLKNRSAKYLGVNVYIGSDVELSMILYALASQAFTKKEIIRLDDAILQDEFIKEFRAIGDYNLAMKKLVRTLRELRK